MIRRPPRSTLFPYTTPSDLCLRGEGTAARRHHPQQRDAPGPHFALEGSQIGGDLGTEIRFDGRGAGPLRSEEHTSELQSQSNLVCRLLLEKKKHRPCITALSPNCQKRSTSGYPRWLAHRPSVDLNRGTSTQSRTADRVVLLPVQT